MTCYWEYGGCRSINRDCKGSNLIKSLAWSLCEGESPQTDLSYDLPECVSRTDRQETPNSVSICMLSCLPVWSCHLSVRVPSFTSDLSFSPLLPDPILRLHLQTYDTCNLHSFSGLSPASQFSFYCVYTGSIDVSRNPFLKPLEVYGGLLTLYCHWVAWLWIGIQIFLPRDVEWPVS